jgi:hypothetical protein
VSSGAAPLSVAILSTWFCTAAVVSAQELTDANVPAVELRVGAVLASSIGQNFDNRLASLRRQFDSLLPYSSYRLITEERRRVGWQREALFRLPGRRYLLVMPREYKDGRVALNVMLVQGARTLVNTAVALRNNGTFLVGGPVHEDGVLIIAIAASKIR